MKILVKKPFPLYDVDAVGMLAVLLIVAIAYLTGFSSLRAQRRTIEKRRAELAAIDQAADEVRARRDRIDEDAGRLDARLSTIRAQVPTADSMTQFLSDLAAMARASDLEVLQMIPGPTKVAERRMTNDVRIAARGSSPDFIRFLRQLERANPHQTLKRISIAHMKGSRDGVCELAWTIRFHMMPADAVPRPGDTG
jgi:Tfp pilus assembly protein PilO